MDRKERENWGERYCQVRIYRTWPQIRSECRKEKKEAHTLKHLVWTPGNYKACGLAARGIWRRKCLLSNADVSGWDCRFPQLPGTKGGIQVEILGVWEEPQLNTFPREITAFGRRVEEMQDKCSVALWTVEEWGRGRGPGSLTRQRPGDGWSPSRPQFRGFLRRQLQTTEMSSLWERV